MEAVQVGDDFFGGYFLCVGDGIAHEVVIKM